MKDGGFRSRNLLDDALTIATIESGVALRAFDADRVEGPLGHPAVREPGEALEGRPGELPPGTLVIADEQRPLALLFGATAAGRGVQPEDRRTLLVAIGVNGVPEIAVEEALWLAAGVDARLEAGAVGDAAEGEPCPSCSSTAIATTPAAGDSSAGRARRAPAPAPTCAARSPASSASSASSFASAFPRRGIEWGVGAVGGPRLLERRRARARPRRARPAPARRRGPSSPAAPTSRRPTAA